MKKATNEIAVVEQKVDGALEASTKMAKAIISDKAYDEASQMLVNVKRVVLLVKQEKKKQLDPANATAKAIRDFWKPFEDKAAEAERVLKVPILKYKQKIDARNAKKEATISKNVEEGKMSFNKGAEKMDAIQSTPVTRRGVETRKIKAVRYLEITTLSPEQLHQLAKDGYLDWANKGKVRTAALAGVVIPGVEVYDDEVVAV